MKTITNLSGTVSEEDINDPRGTLTTLYMEDECCPGWFMDLSLSPSGLRVRTRRPDGTAVAIPTRELMSLFRTIAPELFASPEKCAEAQRARAAARRGLPSTGNTIAP